MLKYFFSRLLLTIPTLLGISIVIFAIIQILPGGPVELAISKMMASGSQGSVESLEIPPEVIASLKAQYGYDKPVVQRYFIWMKDVLTLQFGDSYVYGEPVLKLLGERLPISLSFGLWSFLLIYLISLPLGIYKAVRNGSKFDVSSSVILLVLYSIPGFAMGLILIVFFGSYLELFPIQGFSSEDADGMKFFERAFDYFHHMFLPIVAYVSGGFTITTFLMKDSFLDQISKNYVKTAKAKGLSDNYIYTKHILKNSFIPIATGLSGFLNIFLAGALLLEVIFGLEGIGLLSFESIQNRDYPIVLSIIMISAVLNVTSKIIADLSYVYLNPKINFSANT